jgi:hypothetical protein
LTAFDVARYSGLTTVLPRVEFDDARSQSNEHVFRVRRRFYRELGSFPVFEADDPDSDPLRDCWLDYRVATGHCIAAYDTGISCLWLITYTDVQKYWPPHLTPDPTDP